MSAVTVPAGLGPPRGSEGESLSGHLVKPMERCGPPGQEAFQTAANPGRGGDCRDRGGAAKKQ